MYTDKLLKTQLGKMQSGTSLWNLMYAVLMIYASLGLTQGHWWSLANRNDLEALGGEIALVCDRMKGLSRNQKALCKRYHNHMVYVSQGAKTGIQECQSQFESYRWNCSTVEDETVFGKALRIGSKEVAFAYAIASAGVVHAVARACKTNSFVSCGCSQAPRPDKLQKDWKWGGCGDNTDYAYGFAREFVDAIELDNISPRRFRDKARKAMNLHNNEAGRMAVVRGTQATCKCHGVSGSCSLKTCWSQVPEFKKVGKQLGEEHKKAVEMRISNRGQLKPRRSVPAGNNLVYIEASPDYCRGNVKTGVLGTTGRECNKSSSGPDGCGLLCCGRGFIRKEVVVEQSCDCKFQWCCTVRCQICKKRVLKYICL